MLVIEKDKDKMRNYHRCKDMINLIDYFFIILIINSFIFFYSLFNFFDIKIFHNLQGSKLKLKSPTNFK